MDRRNFLRTLVGGVAVGAAVRQWPFRVYSLPTQIVKPRLDLGFNVFDFGQLPMIESPFVPKDRIYLLNSGFIAHSDFMSALKAELPPDWTKRYLEGAWS